MDILVYSGRVQGSWHLGLQAMVKVPAARRESLDPEEGRLAIGRLDGREEVGERAKSLAVEGLLEAHLKGWWGPLDRIIDLPEELSGEECYGVLRYALQKQGYSSVLEAGKTVFGGAAIAFAEQAWPSKNYRLVIQELPFSEKGRRVEFDPGSRTLQNLYRRAHAGRARELEGLLSNALESGIVRQGGRIVPLPSGLNQEIYEHGTVFALRRETAEYIDSWQKRLKTEQKSETPARATV